MFCTASDVALRILLITVNIQVKLDSVLFLNGRDNRNSLGLSPKAEVQLANYRKRRKQTEGNGCLLTKTTFTHNESSNVWISVIPHHIEQRQMHHVCQKEWVFLTQGKAGKRKLSPTRKLMPSVQAMSLS